MTKSFSKIIRGGVSAKLAAGLFTAKISLAAAVFLFTFSSCDVGLGESVDTQAPTISISYPPVSAVIRDSFILYGSWSDDKTVSGISVSVMNTETKEVVLSNASAEIDSGSWQIELNDYDSSNENYYNGWQFADGTYQISVVATDNAGHSSGTVSRTFDIDNTAPVFIASNPNSVKKSGSVASGFGTTFSIEGTISDDHTISSMDVTIYDDKGNIVSNETYNGSDINYFHEENIATAGGTNVAIAQVVNSSPDERYAAVYGSDTAAGKKYYTCSIKLTDSAQAYKSPVDSSSRSAAQIEEDSAGNSTWQLYLDDDLTSLTSSKNNGLGLSASDLKNILNKTVTNEDAETTLEAKVVDTETYNKDDESNLLYFYLNPQANPTYSVTGFTYSFDDNATLQPASSGSTVTVTVGAGLDGTKIDLDGNSDQTATVKVWLKEFDEQPKASGTYTEEAILAEMASLADSVTSAEAQQKNGESVTFTEWTNADNKDSATSYNDWKLIFDYGQQDETTDESSTAQKTFSVSLPESSISLNKYYMIAVTGCDKDSVHFFQDTAYGFEGNEAGIAPTIKIESPTSSLVDSSGFVFSGTAIVKSSSLYVKELTATLTVTDQNNSNTELDTYTQSISSSADKVWSAGSGSSLDVFTCDSSGNWTFDASKLSDYSTIEAAENSGKSYLYTLDIYGASSSGHNVTVSTNVQVDSILPVIEIASITPTVDGSEYDSSENTYVNGTITVKGTVEETNLESVSMQIFVDESAVAYWTDDDGNATDTLSLGKVYSFSQSIDTTKLTDGKSLDVRVTAIDTVGNSTTYSSLTESDSYYTKLVIWQETDRPIITLNNSSAVGFADSYSNISADGGNLFGTTSNNKLTASISDDDSIVTVDVTIYDKDGKPLADADVYDAYGSNPQTYTVGKASYSLTYYLPPTEGIYKVCIDAYDYVKTELSSKEYGKGTTGQYFIAVTAGAPSITIESSDGGYCNGNSVTVSGTVSGGSGGVTLSAVYSGDGTNSASGTYSSDSEITLSDGSASISDTIDISSLNDDASNGYTATYTVKDLWGQYSSATFKYYKDSTAPDFDDGSSSVGGTATKLLVNSAWFKDETLAVTAVFNESGSGVETVYFWLDPSSGAGSEVVSGDISKASASATASNSNGKATVKTSISGFEESSTAHTLEVVAIDNAGNKSAKQSYSIRIDSTAPDFASSYYTFDGTTFSDASGSVLSNRKKDITVYGTVSDDASGVGEFDLISVGGTKITDAEVSFSTDELPSTVSECADKISELTFNSYDKITDKTKIKSWKLVIPAASIKDGSVALSPTDTAGNGKGNTQKIFTFEVDTTAPAVSFTSPSVSDKVALSSVNGTSSITGKITEAKTPKSLEFYYSTTKSDNLSDYSKLGDTITDASAIYTWSKEFDFNTLSSAETAVDSNGAYTGKASLYILVAASDMAENVNYEDGAITSSDGFVEVSIDLNGDVPTVRITNLTEKDGAYWLVNGEDAKIEGTLSDDDGSIAEFMIFETEITVDSDENLVTSAAENAKLVWKKGESDFTYQPSTTTDGKKQLYFYVKDYAGGIFYTGKNTKKQFTEPKVQVRSGTAVASDEAFAYTSDGTAPTVSSIKIAYSDSESGTYSGFETFTAATVVGGTEKKYAKFQIEASDDIGIESGTLTLSVDDTSSAKTLTFSNDVATSDVYDLSSVLSNKMGYVNVSVVVKDQSGQSGNASSVFTLDNEGPATFSVTTPTSGTISTSDVTVSGIAQDGSGSGIYSVEFAVPTASQNSSAVIGDADENGISSVSNYSDVSFGGDLKDGATAGLWSFVFSSDANGGQLTQYTEAYEKDNSSYALSKSGYIYTIPLWFKLTDKLGNVSVYQYEVSYNPNANWPSAVVTTPKTGTILGTSADFAGTATDNNNVTAVYIQFDLDGDGDYDSDDKDLFAKSNSSETIYTASDLNFSSSGAIKSSDSDWWGVKLSGTTSWNGSFTLPQTGSEEVSWQVRACAVDDENIAGLWSDGSATTSAGSNGVVKFRVDDDAPKIGLTTIYISNGKGNRSYSSDMYVSKSVSENWYLNISLEDTDSGINIDKTVVTAKPSSGSTTTVIGWESTQEGSAITYEGGTYYNYNVKIPLDLSTEGTVTYTVRTVDNSKAALSTSATYSFTVDNTAPTVNAIQFRGESLDMRKLYNTNYEAEISSVVQDDISGMASLNFFFERGGKYYVPFAGGSADSWKMEEVTGSEFELTDGIPGVTVSGSGSAKSATFEISSSDSSDVSFVRAGGIIKVDGSYYNIKSVSGTTVTFDGTLAQDVTSAVFPYALSVNYTTTTTESSSWSSGTYSVGNDDGDGLVETVAKSGAKWTCTASLLSDSIADGTIVLHAVAIDAAGNVSSDVTTRTMIANHTPRLAKVHLASDLNGDGSYSSDEIEEFSALDDSGKTQEVVTLATDIYDVNSKIPDNTNGETDAKAYFKVTGDLVVAPEFVGGQEGEGTVYYDAVIGSKSSPTWDSSNNIHGELASSNSSVSGITAGRGNVLKYLTLSSSAMQDFNKEDKTGTIALSLWDSSEVYKFAGDETSGYTADSTKVDDGTASALDSSDSSGTLYSNFGYQWTIANIPVYFDITDDVAPAGTITPFYWTGEIGSADSDSYNTSENNSIVYYGSTRIGRIDIKTTPDVSGTIKIEGDVSDDQIMKSVAVSVGSIKTTASYTASSSVWSNGTISDSDSTEATLGKNGYVLSISDNSLTQNGHSAKWTLLLNTSKLTNGANEISVTTTQNKTASAGSQLSSTPGTTATASGALTGYYPVTVVPYITKIARTNSTIAAGHSDYGNINRSKLGHYPVAEGEELTVYGWNFGTSAKWSVGTSSTDNEVTPTAGDNNLYSFTMTVPSQSGALIVTSGSVDSVNNSNSDNNPSISGNALVNGLSGENGYNAETYAMRGNSTKYWANDDRYFEVWNLGNGFKNTADGAEFQMPVMTADYSGNLFASWGAASNGQIMFSYGVSGSATPIFNCYDQPAQYTAVAYDKSDKSGNKTGGASVLYMGEQQGLGGTYSGTGLSSSMIIGGAFVTNIPNSYIAASTTSTSKTHVVTGNPSMKMDSDNTTGFFNLANYDMTRRLGSYTNPKAARHGNYLHNVWYDSYTESLKYSLIDLSSETVSNWSNRGAAMAGWVVLDGGYTGQDRLHKWTAVSSTNSTNNELSSGGGYHTVNRKAATDSKYQSGITRFNTDIFLGVAEPKLATSSAYIKGVTSTSLTMRNVSYATAPKVGDTIALMCNDLGSYTMELRRISSVTGNLISWTGELNTDASKIDTATIYEGNLNVVEGSLDSLATSGSHVKSASSGSSADMALDQEGMPVVAYYDDDSETLRIVKATVVNPELASNWVRTETGISCAGSVSIAVDTFSNIHVVYKNSDSEMCYVFGVVGDDGKYTLYGPEVIDSTTSSDYVSVSVVETASAKIPCVSYLGSAGTAQSMKYAYRKAAPSSSGTFSADNWDYMVMPSLGTGHYAISGNPVSTEGRTAGWTSTTESVLTNGGTSATPATVQAAIAFKSKSQFETAYLKTE